MVNEGSSWEVVDRLVGDDAELNECLEAADTKVKKNRFFKCDRFYHCGTQTQKVRTFSTAHLFVADKVRIDKVTPCARV